MDHWPSVADLVDTRPWYQNRGILLVNLCVGLALLTSYTSGFDGSMSNGLQLVDGWQDFFHNPTGSTLGLLTNVQNIGGLIALPFAPLVTDGLGRRKAMFVGGMIMLGGVVLQVQSLDVSQFIIARGLIGFGIAFSVNAAPLLITEVAYPTQRSTITAMYNSMWYVGSIVSAWTTFGTFRMTGSTWSWRIPSALQALPSLLQCTLIWFCPESPRWLISKGKDQEAKEVLGKYHGNGDVNHPLVDYEFHEIKEAIEVEEELGHVSWLALFQTPGNRRRMRIIIALGFFCQWSGNGLVSYYINLILEGVGIEAAATKTLINGILQIFNFVMALTSALFVERIGRRKIFLASNAGMLLVFSIWTVTSALFQETASRVAGNITIVMIFLYYGFYDIAYTPLLVAYAVEILPFRIRAKGFAVLSITINIALIFNQYVTPIALDKIGWKYYLFYVGFLAFELGFIFLYLWETKGRTLEQTAVLFDGEPEADALFVEELSVQARRRESRKISSPERAIRVERRVEVYPSMKRPESQVTTSDVYEMKSWQNWEGASPRSREN
ncbi:hypothetical protein M407DRAFT_27690 [Tulasnella calospora MUT 4182]|uniref:Major facilitator superfamily (MFS) profile domain-containing protein n=1 Tax=Tulasnella calospora MUT 4182 TaxID=1051891 RepID=A0A0C3Q2R2_9AGAM|nr:hypothetical protein M407DRAFT_27690 [Tulasnella calospora MUT 4182]